MRVQTVKSTGEGGSGKGSSRRTRGREPGNTCLCMQECRAELQMCDYGVMYDYGAMACRDGF